MDELIDVILNLKYTIKINDAWCGEEGGKIVPLINAHTRRIDGHTLDNF